MLGNPKRLLLIDALGALFTFTLTEFVLATERVATGVPAGALHALAWAAGGMCVVGGVAYLAGAEPGRVLRVWAVANVLYGLATVIVCILHALTLTGWGFLYFSIEVSVLVALATWEWKTTTSVRQGSATRRTS